MKITVHPVTTRADLVHAWEIRRRVFIEEQGVSEAEEIDGRDEAPSTHHVLAVDGADVPVGTARLLVDRLGQVHVGRVAVLAHLRGHGVGQQIMDALERLAVSEFAGPGGTVLIELSAQETAIGFYQRLGYEVHGERYLDARIWHRDARKTLVNKEK